MQDVPKSVRDSTVLCMVIYIFTAISLCGMARLEQFNPETAMADAFSSVGNEWMSMVIYFCAFFGITAAMFTNLMSQPRNLTSQARDGLLPKIFCELNPKTGISDKAAWITCFWVCIIAFFLDLEQITRVISCGNLLTYSFVTACGVALRFRNRETQTISRSDNERYVWLFLIFSFLNAMSIMKGWPTSISYSFVGIVVLLLIKLMTIDQPNKPRRGHYNAPLVPFLPAIGIQFNFLLACGLDGVTWAYFGAWTLIGLCIYFLYGISYSKLEPKNVTRGNFEYSIVTDDFNLSR